MTDKLKSLSRGKKVLLGIGVALLGLTAIGAAAPPPEEKDKEITVKTASSVQGESTEEAKPKVETKMAEETVAVPFESVTQEDPALPSGQTAIAVAGVNGTRVIVYELTLTDGQETSRKQVSEQVTKSPINEVKKIGTKVAAAPKPQNNCHPSYTGACVPYASDVDCAGGSGNGPAYVSGPVTVVGSDVYDLDRDGDGVACE
jgi:resuscitation-promoting factor RpfB